MRRVSALLEGLRAERDACGIGFVADAGGVPHDESVLGQIASESLPRLEQAVIARPDGVADDELERRLFRVRKRIVRTGGPYIASLSFRTVVFKALCSGEKLADFYSDLARAELAVPFVVFHQRFSTNTAPSWERAQPFRMLAHNGEINTIEGNVNWMRARPGLADVIDASGSDSAM